MRLLLSTTGLATITAALAASPASADTVISTAVTTPVVTSTAGNVEITTTGSVKPPSGVAVTINSNNSVDNKGAIGVSGASNSAGIAANTNLTGNISNSGTITIDENYSPTDSDNDGDIDGPFAQGSGRFGIRVLDGGTFTGNISSTGAILVEGNQSGGIVVDSALAGSLTNGANITVLGNDSVGVRLSDVSGNVRLSNGTISVQGEDAVGVALNGDIGGALVIQGVVQTTGYRYTTVPADASKLDADDLLQNGSAVVVGGNVAGGILFDARPADNDPNDTDEDDDGNADAQESTATITSLGAAPAVLVGSSSEDISIGAVAGAGGRGLVVKGTITGNGLYGTIAGNGLVIGGLGRAVDVAGGVTVSGSITARALEANATAIRIGAGATVPVVDVSGQVLAEGAGTASTGARAIVIDSGANVSTIRNSGSILAGLRGTDGTAAAIVDSAGTVTLVENSGRLGVISADTLGDKATALDLRANTSGVTVRQLAAASGRPAPAIGGMVLFGSGNDLFDVEDGVVSGAVRFGAGNDTLRLSGDALVVGNVDFGGGADVLTLAGTSRFRGQLSNSSGLDVTVGAGTTLDVTNTGTVNLASLTTGAGATLGVTLNSSTDTVTLYDVAGAASFGADTKIDVNLLTVGGVAGTYKVVQAGSLAGAGNLSSSVGALPFLYDSSLTTAGNEVSLVVRLRTAEELQINQSESSILEAVIGAADADAPVASVLLGIEDSETLRASLQQMLPEHAGGAFETATKGSRLLGRSLLDPQAAPSTRAPLGAWVQQVAWGSSKSIGATSSYDVTGWGAAGGVETDIGNVGKAGLMLSYLAGRDSNEGVQELMSSQFEGGAYLRGGFGPLRAFARATAARVSFDGVRNFTGVAEDGSTVSREAEGEWSGNLYSAMAGLSYDAQFGRLSLRPSAMIEHYKLSEDGYEENGGGDAFNLIVDERSSDETAASGTVALGYSLLGSGPESTWLRLELEGGRRQILSGALGTTTARFANGDPFTLTPEDRTSGWLGALRLLGGGPAAALTGEVSAEEQQGEISLGGRLSIRLSL